MPRTDEYYPALLVIRTDYRDEPAWQALKNALAEPWGPKGDESVQEVLYVDDLAWAEAGVDEVLAALTDGDGEDGGECGWSVVFIADRLTMKGVHGPLLAVDTDPEPPGGETSHDCSQVRIDRGEAAHDMHGNLSLGNMDFSDYMPKRFF
ncbi:DUF6924 domain-containing protein [Streptomyces tendae]|uniref:DUF6924 domain-containing protein n=1 Tax=Streptomyces tendae TaxID=1932 RepID=UPI0037AC128A